MKVELEVTGPRKTPGKKWGWGFSMHYEDLPEEYAGQVTTLAESFASAVTGTAGNATGSDPAYAADFKVHPDAGGKPISGKATGLQYSQMTKLQRDGHTLLGKLIEFGEIEVKSGQRK
jgi:hypothetical protein